MEKHRIGDGGTAGFEVLGGTSRSQGAFMTLAAGEATGGPDNLHATSDQWLFVAEGSGSATVEGKRVPLEAGDLLLVAAGESHEIRASDDAALVTLSVYAPPAY
jgi:mannose-6-phosphate isomerase-like protein (cupin superfamily)